MGVEPAMSCSSMMTSLILRRPDATSAMRAVAFVRRAGFSAICDALAMKSAISAIFVSASSRFELISFTCASCFALSPWVSIIAPDAVPAFSVAISERYCSRREL